MLHGLFGSLATWYFTSAPTIAHTHEVLMYDLRGHGKSDRPTSGYDLKTMCADLHTVLNACLGLDRECPRYEGGQPRSEATGRGALTSHVDTERVALVGHSYGGVIALRYALDHPERVGRLALVDIPMPPSNMEEIDFLTKRSPEELIDMLPNRIRQAIRSGERGRKAERNLELLRSLIFESTLVNDVSAEPDFSDDLLSRLTCPIRCIYGDRSSCLDAGRRLSCVLPNCELVLLQGGHYLPAESAAALTESLREFLNG